MSTLPFPDFGSLLRRHRRAAGLTQEELAERAGISEDTISILERGVSRFPHQETVELLAEALRLPPAERAHFSAVARGRLTGPEGLPGLSPFSSTEWESPPVVLAQRLHSSRDLLPVPPTPLLGREQEVQTICMLVQSPAIRLLTLTGSAGVGKTRLALQVAREVVDDFPSGVHFISLAALRDPALVLPAIAQSLGLEAVTNRSPLIHLQTYLRDQHLLLVLDNFEQIIPAAPQLAEVLSGCPDLHLLVTSREVLHLRVEHQFEVAPLALPILPSRDRRQPMDWQALAQSPAVQLFVQRAQAVHPEFQLTPGNASSVAEICIRLDGIPLAIELAAPRIRLLSPQALLARLAGRLQVLSGEAQDLPERQRTLRDTIAWSYDLLTSPEQRLFRRLAIFLDGCTLPAAEAVCQELDQGEADLFQEMASLLDKSLVKRVASTEEEPRFLLLEMLREFGLEQLAARGELEATRLAHAHYYLHLAEEAFPELSASHQERWWLDRLERDEENLRAALVWLVEQGERGHLPMELALRLGGVLERYWLPRGFGRETLDLMERALRRRAGVPEGVQARALFCAGHLAFHLGNLVQAEALARDQRTLCQEQGDPAGMAWALSLLGMVALRRRQVAEAGKLHEEALALRRACGDEEGIAWSLLDLAHAALAEGLDARAQSWLAESLAIFQRRAHPRGKARVLDVLGWLTLEHGDWVTARQIVEEGLRLFEEIGIKRGMAACHAHLARIAFYQGDLNRADLYAEASRDLERDLFGEEGPESLWLSARVAAAQGDDATARLLYERMVVLSRTRDNQNALCLALDGLASLARTQNKSTWAARLWGAAEALRERTGSPLRYLLALPGRPGSAEALRQATGRPIREFERTGYEREVEALRAQLGKAAFDVAWAEGRGMTPEQVLVAEHLVALDAPPIALPTPAPVPSSLPEGLTAREVEVLRLLARGLKNDEIARQLVITPETVKSHLKSIFSKLGVTNRAAATRYAFEHQLV